MDFVPKNRILQVRPDTLEEIRKEYNFDKPGRMKEAVQLLYDWVQKQPHFRKKDFGTFYLETTIIGSKGLLERAKTQLDKICTMRTILPIFFGNYNVKTDFINFRKAMLTVLLPQLTPDHYRVNLTKFHNVSFEASQIHDFYKYNIIVAEYLKTHDYLRGFIAIADFSEANMMDFVSRVNPMQLREAFRIFLEGYGMRIKSINIISPSKFVDALVTILKQVLSQKIGERIHVYKTLEDIPKIVPKQMLPREYGGEEKSLKELSDEWLDILSSKEHMERIAYMNSASTDESCRPQDKFSEQYAGMPGSFRLLSVD